MKLYMLLSGSRDNTSLLDQTLQPTRASSTASRGLQTLPPAKNRTRCIQHGKLSRRKEESKAVSLWPIPGSAACETWSEGSG
jgi:hypothetical protein